GLALGTILRRTAGAIATLVGLVFIADLLVEALPSPWNTDIGKFLPGNAGLALFSVRPDPDRLTPGPALIVLLVWLAVAFVLAPLTLTKRDAGPAADASASRGVDHPAVGRARASVAGRPVAGGLSHVLSGGEAHLQSRAPGGWPRRRSPWPTRSCS